MLVPFVGSLVGPGNIDGIGTAAGIGQTDGLAIDGAGSLYATDESSNTIRKITLAGVVTTFAGTAGASGSTDGVGAAARFTIPAGITADGSGNLYVVDFGNNTIRKITPAGVVTTFAGTAGASGSTDATGAAARFNSPFAIAIDGSGNLFVSDRTNNKIRMITPAAVVTTFAGSGAAGSTDATGIAASFNAPEGLTIDGSGNLFVADNSNNKIRMITPAGVVTTFAGSGAAGSTDATGTAASFNGPQSVAFDSSGNLYVAERNNNAIRMITPAAVVTTFAGASATGFVDGTGASARFNDPSALIVDAANNLYVGDVFNSCIRKITPAAVVTTFAGSALKPGSADGTGPSAGFSRLSGGAADGAGNLYVADFGNSTIRKITSAGVVTTFAGTAGVTGSTDATGTAARFSSPFSIAIDSSGNLYVADFSNNKIRKITPAGVVTTFAGSGAAGHTDATGTAASFSGPQGIAIDGSSNLYVADTNNQTIRKITSAGVVTTFAGTFGASGSTDGIGPAARFNSPGQMAADSLGNLYVSDVNNQTIRKITPAGVVTTFAGTAGVSGSTDGAGTAARFHSPAGIAVDSLDNLYVSDFGNSTIRKITPAGVVTTIVGVAGAHGFTSGSVPGTILQSDGVAFLGSALVIFLQTGAALALP